MFPFVCASYRGRCNKSVINRSFVDVGLEGALSHLAALDLDPLVLELLQAEGLFYLAVVIDAELGTADAAGDH